MEITEDYIIDRAVRESKEEFYDIRKALMKNGDFVTLFKLKTFCFSRVRGFNSVNLYLDLSLYPFENCKPHVKFENSTKLNNFLDSVEAEFKTHIEKEKELLRQKQVSEFLVDDRYCNNENKDYSYLVGKTVKGFKFESTNEVLQYYPEMDGFIGLCGTVTDSYTEDGEVKVQFDSNNWYYPAHLAEKHIVWQSNEELEQECVRRYGDNWRYVKIKAHANGEDCEGYSLNDGGFNGWIFCKATEVWNRNGLLMFNNIWAETL